MLPLPSGANPGEFDALIAAVRQRTPTPKEIAALARHLADSGDRLEVGPGPPTADLASTGGPGSLSTLLVPLALVSSGFRVPKLGVPGRPAGAIDALATLSGYRSTLTLAEARNVLAESGYVHCLADQRFAPLDADLFAHRRRTGAVNVPPLAVASLLAKKLAFEVMRVGLDVRVFVGGNFGDVRAAARESAALFVATARELGLDAVCVVHEGPRAWQPHLGRGESLAALHAVLTGRATGWLADHAALCLEMAGQVIGGSAPPLASLRLAFESHLAAQGSSWAAFQERAGIIEAASRISVRAPHSGFARGNLLDLRHALVSARPDANVPPFPDGAGISLAVPPGAPVEPGVVLAGIRIDDQAIDADTLLTVTATALTPAISPPLPTEAYVEIVSSRGGASL